MKKIIIGVIVVVCIVLLLIFNINNKDKPKLEKISSSNEVDKKEYTNVKFDIKGYVLNPGVYEIGSDARISDAIVLAGGLLSGANTRYTNLSKIIDNEMVIVIYGEDEIVKMFEEEVVLVCPDIETKCPVNEVSELVNINKASLEDLMTLPGIGESKAQDIIEYRSTKLFSNIDELMEVKGIGESTFEKLKILITV